MTAAADVAAVLDGARKGKFGSWQGACPICGDAKGTLIYELNGSIVFDPCCKPTCNPKPVRAAILARYHEHHGVELPELLTRNEAGAKAKTNGKANGRAKSSKRHANGAAATPSWADQCTKTPAGAIDGASVRNVLLALRHAPDWQDVLAFDAFALRHIIRREIPSAGDHVTRPVPRMLEDSDVVAALEWFHGQGMVKLRKTMLYDAMLLHARDHGRFHPVLDFFNEVLAGDAPPEVPSAINGGRIDPDLLTPDALDLLLVFGFGASDTQLNRAIGRAFMISMVRRVRRPGCQSDHVLVLKGEQGIGKSSGLALLVGRQWFTDHLPDLHSKDALIQLHGKVLVEWAELGAMKRAQIERTKAFVTSREDTFRPPFERATIDVPRTCTFAGTTNDDAFIDDASGGRRFWPVECEQVDLGWIAANRGLIWRLAAEAEAAGEGNWVAAIDLQAELIEHQADAQRDDAWEDIVLDYVTEHALDSVIINAAFVHSVIGIAVKDQHNGHIQRIASILKRAKWRRSRNRSRADGRARRWLPPRAR